MVNNYLLCCVRVRPSFLGDQVLPSIPRRSIGSSSSTFKLDSNQANHRSHAFQLFFNSVHQFTAFARRFSPFQQLPDEDQQLLLRQGVLELSCLRAAFNFDVKKAHFLRTSLCWSTDAADRWDERCECGQRAFSFNGNQNNDDDDEDRDDDDADELYSYCKCRLKLLRYERVPVARASLLQPLLGVALHQKLMRFVRALNECSVDEPVLLLLSAILLFSGERTGVHQPHLINTQQDACVRLLQKYMHWKHGPEAHGPLMARLLLTLPELRELAELFADCPLEQLQHQQSNRADGSCCASSSTGSGSEYDGCESDCWSRSDSPRSEEDYGEMSHELQHQLKSLALNQSHGSNHEQTQLLLQTLDEMLQESQTKLFSIQQSVCAC